MGNLTEAHMTALALKIAELVGGQPGGMRSADIVKELAKENVSRDDAANSIVFALDDGLIRLGAELKYFPKSEGGKIAA